MIKPTGWGQVNSLSNLGGSVYASDLNTIDLSLPNLAVLVFDGSARPEHSRSSNGLLLHPEALLTDRSRDPINGPAVNLAFKFASGSWPQKGDRTLRESPPAWKAARDLLGRKTAQSS